MNAPITAAAAVSFIAFKAVTTLSPCIVCVDPMAVAMLRLMSALPGDMQKPWSIINFFIIKRLRKLRKNAVKKPDSRAARLCGFTKGPGRGISPLPAFSFNQINIHLNGCQRL
ncbi:MAG: hypothetical protein M3Z21_16965 [Pseudomonadota bacterium]|nr:hypothetical protein [Pseudomonadota bacterium]